LAENPYRDLPLPPDELLTDDADWTPGWQIADEILESREQEAEFEGATD